MAKNRYRRSVSGVQVHEARLVATMRVIGISNLLTLNVQDFRRYPDIEAVTQTEAVRGQSPICNPLQEAHVTSTRGQAGAATVVY